MLTLHRWPTTAAWGIADRRLMIDATSCEHGILHTQAEPRCTVILFGPFTITLLIVGSSTASGG